MRKFSFSNLLYDFDWWFSQFRRVLKIKIRVRVFRFLISEKANLVPGELLPILLRIAESTPDWFEYAEEVKKYREE